MLPSLRRWAITAIRRRSQTGAVAAFEQTTAQKDRFTIVLDAGHGGEDPGAVANGAIEKDINLSIAKKLKDFLELTGINVVLTRDKDVLLYTQEQAKSKKMYDLKNRLAFAEGFENAVFISIHMNKFTAERYFGPQTFYSENDARGLMLAECVQRATKLFSPDNTRVIKPENGTIYILENIQKPAVLVECGFYPTSVKLTFCSRRTIRTQWLFLCSRALQTIWSKAGPMLNR